MCVDSFRLKCIRVCVPARKKRRERKGWRRRRRVSGSSCASQSTTETHGGGDRQLLSPSSSSFSSTARPRRLVAKMAPAAVFQHRFSRERELDDGIRAVGRITRGGGWGRLASWSFFSGKWERGFLPRCLRRWLFFFLTERPGWLAEGRDLWFHSLRCGSLSLASLQLYAHLTAPVRPLWCLRCLEEETPGPPDCAKASPAPETSNKTKQKKARQSVFQSMTATENTASHILFNTLKPQLKNRKVSKTRLSEKEAKLKLTPQQAASIRCFGTHMLIIPHEECGICFKGRNPKQESGFTKINFPITPQRSRSVQMLIRNKVVFFSFHSSWLQRNRTSQK